MAYGTNRLLKLGAKLALNAKDIIDCFKELDYEENRTLKGINENLIPEQYLEIYKAIQKSKQDINSISRSLRRPINELNSLLFMMELDGIVLKLPNGEYTIKGD